MIRVAFCAKRPMNYAIFRPIHERLLLDPRVEVSLYGKSAGRNDPTILERANALPARRRPSWIGKFTRPDILFSAKFIVAAKKARVKIQIFHGMSIKNVFLSDRILDYDVVFAIGPYMVRRYLELGFFEEGDPRLNTVGFPKTDPLTNGSLDRSDTLRSLGLDPDRPTVLYAPSWNEESSLDARGEKILSSLQDVEANVIVKLHDNAYDPRFARRDWRSYLDGVSGPAFAAPDVWDVIPLMHAADLLVSDVSSVSYEYLQLDRPIVFLTHDAQLRRWEGQADLETWGHRVGVEVSDVDDLTAAIDEGLAHPEHLGPVRREACADLFFNVGSATDAAVAELYSALGESQRPHPTRSSPHDGTAPGRSLR